MRAAAVAAVAVLALALGAGGAGAGSSADGAEVAIPGKLYAPGELNALVGQIITWRNTDTKSHTVTSDGRLFDSGYLAPGGSFSRTFAATGVFPYHCTIHRSMRGVVRVYALILTGPPRALPPGWAVVLRGVSPTPGGDVVLDRIVRGTRSVVAQTTAAADGSFSFALRPIEPAAFRARAGDASSPAVRVSVKPNVAAAVAGRRLLVSTTPKRPLSPVDLQLYDRDRFDWITVATQRLDAASRTTFALPPGKLRARAVVRGRAGWSDGVSRTIVRRASA